MKFRVYTLYDSDAESYGPVFISENDKTAKRMLKKDKFVQEMRENSPGCLKLYNIGSYDNEHGRLEADIHVLLDMEN